MKTITIELNGENRSVTIDDDETLLYTLRERLGITSTKNGCAPQGQCGACLAVVDGKTKTTCAMPASKAADKTVLTLEGVPAAERDLVARCFVANAGIQCGFCIPGIAMRAINMVEQNPNPSRDEIAQKLDVHLCRCTGYLRIIDAVEMYAKVKRGELSAPPLCEDGHIGKPLARYQGMEGVLGMRPYVDDLRFPGMVFGAVVQPEFARSVIVKIDTEPAKQLPGVIAVLTAADIPGERYVGLIRKDWPIFVAEGETNSCIGDVLAVVVAGDEATARRGAQLVVVTAEPLTPVTDPEAGMAADSPLVLPNTDSNILSKSVIFRGDAEKALAESAYVVEDVFQTQRIEHLFLEPESAVAVPETNGRIHLYTQGQGVFDDQRQVAAMLAVPLDRIFVELVPNGGAFGGKEDMSIQGHAALIAFKLGVPAKVTLTREESIRMHPKRHPIRMHYRMGCDANGKLTAVWARMIGDTGAYASVGEKVLERAAGHGGGPYVIPHVDIQAVAVRTNNPPCGAMRGFGANQAAFAVEGCMDRLAEKLGIDGWEMRWRNALAVGDSTHTGQILHHSVGIRKTLVAVKDRYYAALAQGKAVGIGCGMKNSGLGNGALEWGAARLVIEAADRIALYNGYTEMGQGLFTVLVQFAVEVTGIPAAFFHPRVDANHPLPVGQTTGSRATLLGGLAVKDAAEKLRAALDSGRTLADLVGVVFAGDVKIDDTTKLGDKSGRPTKTHTTYAFATQVVILDENGRPERVVAAHDVGRVVNPDLCAGQIEGSVHMGLGYALTEELPCDAGIPVTYKLRDIGVLRARDMPPVDVILVEDPEPAGPFGAKGVGEIGLVPTAGATAGALYAFDKQFRTVLPMKNSAAAKAMSVGKIKGRG